MTNGNSNYSEEREALMYIKSSISVPEYALNKHDIILEKAKDGTPMYGIPKKFAEKQCRDLSSSDLILKCEQALAKLATEAKQERKRN